MKRILALALAVLMVLSLSVAAFADTTAPLADRTHTYTAYKIFAGTQTDEEGDATLGSITWGNGINSTNFLAALKASTAFGTTNPFATIANTSDADVAAAAAKVAEAMKDWADGSDEAMAFAKLAEDYIVAANGIACTNGITTLEAGYYLVVDTTAQADVKPDDAYNIALLQLTKKETFAITPKNTVPEVKKEVSDEGALNCTNPAEGEIGHDANHVHTKDCYTWADSNNVALGDTVHFKIESAVPATATEYEYYFFIINDTLSKGLTYDANSLKVYIDGDLATATTDYTVKTAAVLDTNNAATGETNIQIALVDAIAHAGAGVIVTYDAVLNKDAIIGVKGNPNAVTVDFSNNPNEDWDGDEIPSDGFPKDTTHKPNGKTPEDYTLTFVSKINIYKVDGENNPLQGAEFTLIGETLNKVLVFTEQFTKDATGTYYKLTNGTYTEEKPITEDYMKPAEEDATAGYVIDNDYTGEDAITVGGVVYRAYVPATDASKTVYILVKANADLYDDTETMYKCEWVSTTETAAAGTGTDTTLRVVASVDDNGVVSFAGLPAGSYTISETVVPNGFNPIDDIEFTIDWTVPEDEITTGTEECTWDVAEGDTSGVTYNEDANAFEITIVNQKGGTLPETGGIGTTIFYVLGGVLVVAAAILLITKKRMSAEG